MYMPVYLSSAPENGFEMFAFQSSGFLIVGGLVLGKRIQSRNFSYFSVITNNAIQVLKER